MTLDVQHWVDALEHQGARLAAAADRAGLDAPVPSCPGWSVRDLVAHTGGVHRWAAWFVTTGTVEPTREQLQGDVFFDKPVDAELLDWFRAGHAGLVAALRAADPQLTVWTFLRAPSPLAFWARRQAHETTIHRVDAELAAGGDRSDVPAALATDGIDELFTGFLARRRGRLVADPPVALGVRTTDTNAAWTLTIGTDSRAVSVGTADGDCVLSGAAADLYLFLWNRRDRDGIDVVGDDAVLELWREKATIVWS
jgi:uncharacterized protein (TIGR03083 family)